jgi:hypothetical protein
LDLSSRLVIIERKDAIKFGYDPAIVSKNPQIPDSVTGQETTSPENDDLSASTLHASRSDVETKENSTLVPSTDAHKLSFLNVATKLVKSPRALTGLLFTFVYG